MAAATVSGMTGESSVSKVIASGEASELPRWTALAGETDLVCTLKFPGFSAAVAFLVQVALVAERLNHHPEIILVVDKVTLRLTTHETGSLTESDLKLAKAIEDILKVPDDEVIWC